ncbi:MAG: AmmeMemoRadiSam system radical SAM enzyme [Nitrosarchaeum sp.]|nr:AmmeMemoRadiSam system radical SAM enzyme [Nitrosarchaeum sp.]
MKLATWSQKLHNNIVKCTLCPHFCVLSPDQKGVCLTRQNIEGRLYTLNYCAPATCAIDPVEKKPLFHFYPGSKLFSMGPNGCNFKCTFCQNHEISQNIVNTKSFKPQQLIQTIKQYNTIGVAYTFTEPFIWYETIRKIAPEIKNQGLKNVMVSNGFYNLGPLKQLLPLIDAFNIDIKSDHNRFYKDVCKASLSPVLKACETIKKHCHLEISVPLIPNTNIDRIVRYIYENLGDDIPLHLVKYFPVKNYSAMTSETELFNAKIVAKHYLKYVYFGNVSDLDSTICPSCKTTLVVRSPDVSVIPCSAKYLICNHCFHLTNIQI